MVAGYWFSIGRVRSEVDDDDCETAVWWAKMSQLFAYRFCLNREAWRLFCDEIGICPGHVVDGAPGGWIIELAGTNIPSIAPTDEEMAEQIRDLLGHEVELSDVVTVETAMEDWQDLYRVFEFDSTMLEKAAQSPAHAYSRCTVEWLRPSSCRVCQQLA